MTSTRRSEPPVRFVLLSTQRSGTGWVMDHLVSHPAVAGYGELFLPSAEGSPTWPKPWTDRPFYTTYLRERGSSRRSLKRPYHTLKYLARIYKPRQNIGAVGFKLMYDTLKEHPEIWTFLVAYRVRIVHLTRRNLLDIALSRRALELRGSAQARVGQQVERIRISVPVDELLFELRRLRMERRLVLAALRVTPCPVAHVAYEDLRWEEQGGQTASLDRILEFLTIDVKDRPDLKSSFLKLAPESHRDVIVNYDEVRAGLVAAGWGRLLRE